MRASSHCLNQSQHSPEPMAHTIHQHSPLFVAVCLSLSSDRSIYYRLGRRRVAISIILELLILIFKLCVGTILKKQGDVDVYWLK